MTDIFLSYKREDQSTARLLADALVKNGRSVWWDPKIRTGDDFNEAIEKAIKDARCLIVLWSELSVGSKYVRAEAMYALNRKKPIFPVAIDDLAAVSLPLLFESLHTRLLARTEPDSSQEFQNLLSDLTAQLGPPERAKERRDAKGDDSNQQVLPRASVTKTMRRWAMALRFNKIKVAVSISVVSTLAILLTVVHYSDWKSMDAEREWSVAAERQERPPATLPVPPDGDRVAAAPQPRAASRSTIDYEERFNAIRTNELELSRMGERAFEERRYDWAIRSLEQARSVQSSGVWQSSYPYLIGSYLAVGRKQDAQRAIEELNKEINGAIERRDGYLGSYNALGVVLANFGRVRERYSNPQQLAILDAEIDTVVMLRGKARP